jgi:hypothetical protein
MKFFRKVASKRKNPIIRTCKARHMMLISGAYYNFLAPMPSSMTAKQFLEEGSNKCTARVPQTSYFYASLLVGTLAVVEQNIGCPFPHMLQEDLTWKPSWAAGDYKLNSL